MGHEKSETNQMIRDAKEAAKELGISSNDKYSIQSQGQCGTTVGRPDSNASLTERLAIRRDRAERESSKASALSELLYLLEKNPDVARILNLMDQVER